MFGYACDRCREKHQSCDHAVPCQRCVRAGLGDFCHYTPKKARNSVTLQNDKYKERAYSTPGVANMQNINGLYRENYGQPSLAAKPPRRKRQMTLVPESMSEWGIGYYNGYSYPLFYNRSYSLHCDQLPFAQQNLPQGNYFEIPPEPLPYTFNTHVMSPSSLSPYPSAHPFGFSSFSPAPTPPTGCSSPAGYTFPPVEDGSDFYPDNSPQYVGVGTNALPRSASIPCASSPLVPQSAPSPFPSPNLAQQSPLIVGSHSPLLPSAFAGIPFMHQNSKLGDLAQNQTGVNSQNLHNNPKGVAACNIASPNCEMGSAFTHYQAAYRAGSDRRNSCPISDMFLTDALDLQDPSL